MTDTDEQALTVALELTDAQVQGEADAILAPAHDFPTNPDDLAFATGTVVVQVTVMRLGVRRGHQHGDVLAKQFVGAETEGLLRRPIRRLENATGIDDHDGIHRRIENGTGQRRVDTIPLVRVSGHSVFAVFHNFSQLLKRSTSACMAREVCCRSLPTCADSPASSALRSEAWAIRVICWEISSATWACSSDAAAIC